MPSAIFDLSSELPLNLRINLARNSDFKRVIRTADGSPFPAGAAVQIIFGDQEKLHVDALVTWHAVIVADKATFNEDRVAVNEVIDDDLIIRGNKFSAELYYQDASGVDITWATTDAGWVK